MIGHPAGLYNAGNTCFANSSLQALMSTRAFDNLVLNVKKFVKLSPGKVKNLSTPARRSLRSRSKVTEWLVHELTNLKSDVDSGGRSAADASSITMNVEKVSMGEE